MTEQPTPDCTQRAAQNIAAILTVRGSRSALVVCSPGKRPIAGAVAAAAQSRGMEAHCLLLARQPAERSAALLRAVIDLLGGAWGLALLCTAEHAGLLFDLLRRPDRGLRLPEDAFFCDWLLPADMLVRLYDVDMDELAAFRRRLLLTLGGAQRVHVTSPAGTDLHLRPRDWRGVSLSGGEVYTAPIEDSVDGTVVVDGSVYYGSPPQPFSLHIAQGRIANLDELDATDH